jgi:hypothetical protein
VNVATEIDPNTYALVRNDRLRRFLLMTMCETFKATSHTEIRARLRGYAAPPVLQGAQENHRPDLLCLQPDKKKTPILLDVVTAESFEDEKAFVLRFGLFISAAGHYGWEIHIACPNCALNGETLEQRIRMRLKKMDFTPNKIWAV